MTGEAPLLRLEDVIGPNGAGKSAAPEAIVGPIRPERDDPGGQASALLPSGRCRTTVLAGPWRVHRKGSGA